MELGVELPEEIIQHIQSFMEIKLSARTALLSKSWYKAWSTRPNLDFDSFRIYFKGYFNELERYLDFVTRTAGQRYIHENLNVHKVKLSLRELYFSFHYHQVDNLIVDILKLRINVLHLDFWFGSCYVLSAQVFANKYLTELHLSACRIDYLDPCNILCSNLRFVVLYSVYIEESTFKNILLRCPFIEYLNLSSQVKGSTRINATELLNLKTLIVNGSVFSRCVFRNEFNITSSVICGPFLNLSRLVLSDVHVDESFFTNISSSFPKLEDLTLEYLDNRQTFKISSRSITSLRLNYLRIMMAELDVPNIRNFKFSGKRIFLLSFTASKEWKSEILLYNPSGTIDLSRLGEFLIQLGQSKITLRLSIQSKSRNIAPERNIENFHLPEMEELVFCVSNCEEYNFFVKCLLYCRPRLVSLHFYLDYQQASLETLSIQYMYKKLIEQRNQNGTQNLEVEEVNAELFEESLKQWQTVKTWSDDHGAATPRFKLKWGSLTPAYTIIKLIQYYHIQEDYIDFLSQF